MHEQRRQSVNLVEVWHGIDCLPEWSERTEVEFLTYVQCNWWWFLCCRGEVCVRSSHFYIFCLFDWHPKCLVCSAKVTLLLILENHPKTCLFPSVCSTQTTVLLSAFLSFSSIPPPEIVMHILCVRSDITVMFYWCACLVMFRKV